MHALESILAQHSGRSHVAAGDLITIDIDIAGVNDLYIQVIEEFRRMGGKRVWDPSKIVFFFDHYSPPSTIPAASNQRVMREFCHQQGIEHLYDVNEGVCHRVLQDHGLVTPGSTIVVTDSHTTTHGAFGAFSTGVGATDMAAILLTGKMWVRVPEVLRIEIEGTPATDVAAKDIILHVLGTIGADGAVYKAIEFAGSALSRLSLGQRAVLTNMGVEMGAKAAFIEPSDLSLADPEPQRSAHLPNHKTDPDFTYAETFSFDIGALSPQVARPGAVDATTDVADVEGTHIDQAYIGGCTGGSIEDLEIAAMQLKGRHIAPGVRLLVSPASRSVYMHSIRNGYIATIVDAGGTVLNPGCGPCLGIHQGLVASGETCISAASRNFSGRMGSPEAQIYLASPATVAASAVAGVIAPPHSEEP